MSDFFRAVMKRALILEEAQKNSSDVVLKTEDSNLVKRYIAFKEKYKLFVAEPKPFSIANFWNADLESPRAINLPKVSDPNKQKTKQSLFKSIDEQNLDDIDTPDTSRKPEILEIPKPTLFANNYGKSIDDLEEKLKEIND